MLSWLHSEVTSVVSAIFHTPSFAEHFISKLKKYGNTVVDTEDGFLTFEIKEASLGFVDTTGQVRILKAPWEEELAKYLESIRSKIVYIDYGDLSEVWEEADFSAYKNELVAQGLIELEPRITFHDLEINQTITFNSEVALELYLKWVNRYGRPDEEIEESPNASKLLAGSLAVSSAFVGAGMLRGLEHLATKVTFGHGFVAANSLVLSCAQVVSDNPGMFGLAALVYFTGQAPVAAALDIHGWNTTFAEVLSSRAYGNAETGYLAGTENTGYALAGGSGLDAKIMLLDSEFGLTWGRMLNESVSFNIAGIARTTDQGLVVVGGTTLGAGAGDGVVLKVSAAGEKLFAKTIGDTDKNTLTAVAATIDGGFITAGNTLEYSNTWAETATLAPLPEVRGYHAVVGYNEYVYVFGGNNLTSVIPSVVTYNILTDTWTTQNTTMIVPALYVSGVLVDNKIYVIGGCYESATLDVLREYTPGIDSWGIKSPMSVSRESLAVAVVDNKIYVFGGFYRGVGFLSSVEMYDPQTDVWSTKNSMSVARYGATATVVNGKIYVIGGKDSVGTTCVVEEYDPGTDVWSLKTSMSVARATHGAIEFEGRIYVFGGGDLSNGALDSVAIYDPATDIWSSHASLNIARYIFANKVANKIYIIGGDDTGYARLSVVESYMPSLTKKALLTKISNAGLLEWNKSYSAIQTSINSVVTLSDGYLVVGAADLTDGSTHMLLFKTDTTGMVTFSQTYGITYGVQEGRQVIVTPTGYVIAGYTHDTGDGIIIKVDTSGAVLWGKKMGVVGDNVITQIKATADDGVIVTATINLKDALLFKLTSSGALSWSRLWNSTDSSEKLTAVTQDASGNYLVLGATDQLSWPKLDTVLMRLNSSGEFLDDCTLFNTTWSDIADVTVTSASITLTTSDVTPILATAPEVGLREIDFKSSSLCATTSSSSEAWTSHAYFANRYTTTNYGDVAASVLVPITSGYVLAGGASLDMKITMLDNDFYPVWSRMFASRINFVFGGLTETQDGGLVLAGSTTGLGSGSSNALVLKLDDSGDRVWGKVIGDTYADTARSVIATSDGGVAIAGRSLEYNNMWADSATLKSLPEALGYHVAVAFNSSIYVFGGLQNSGLLQTSTFVYDVDSDDWSNRSSTMPNAAYGVAGALLDGKIYVIGGHKDGTTFNTTREYDPNTDQWTVKNSMLMPRASSTAVVLNGKIYVFGGWATTDMNTVEVYDPATDAWESRSSMVFARSGLSATVLNDKVYVIGGSGTAAVEEYDPITDVWLTKKPQLTVRDRFGIAKFEGKIYVFGGSNSVCLDTVEVYDVATDSWSSHESLSMSIRQVWSTQVDNKIYIIGGFSISVYKEDVGLYTFGFKEKALVSKLGMTGVQAWSRSYQSIATSFNAMLQTIDDGYLALGSTATNKYRAMILQKTDASGLHAWAKIYSGVWPQEGQGLITTTTGYMLWGSSYESETFYVGVIAKLDTTGNVLWSKQVGTGIFSSQVITSVCETSDNGFLVIASTGDDAILFKLDSSGVLQWSRGWSTSAKERLAALATETNGDILVLGTTDQFTSPKVETLLMRLDSTGNMDGSCVLATSTWGDIADGTLMVASITPTVTSFTPTVTDAGVDVRAISLEVASTCYRPSVATSLASQTNCCAASIGNAYSFTFDEATFDVSSATSYSVTLADGSDLPSWLTFTAGARSFTGIPTGSVTNLAIKVTGTDSNGGTASDTFTLSIVGSLTVTNGSGAISYTEDTPYNMPDIEVSTPSSNVTAALTLSDIAAGSLNIATSFGVTSSYNAATGLWQASGAKADVNSLLAGLVFTPASDKSGAFSITVAVTDGYGQTVSSTLTATGIPVNDAPVISQITKTGSEDSTMSFIATDFTSHYTDIESDALTRIQITSLPIHGSLFLDATAVTVNQEILVDDLGKLTFAPEADWTGTTSFGWRASDGTDYSAANTVSLTVNVANDAPVISEVTKIGTEDVTVSFTVSDFTSHYSDIDGDSLASIQITSLPQHGNLMFDGVAITLNQEIVAAELSKLKFIPEADWHGATSFGFRASDGIVYSSASTVSITLSAINDAPVLVNNVMYITQGQKLLLTEDIMSATDDEVAVTALLFKVSDVTHGRFELITDPGVGILSFTQQQITARQVRFVHDGSEAAPSYKVAVSDGTLETTPIAPILTFATKNALQNIIIPVIGGVAAVIVIGGAIGLGIFCYRHKKHPRGVQKSQKIWQIDWRLVPPISHVHGYRLIPIKQVATPKTVVEDRSYPSRRRLGEEDYRRVIEAYQRCPVPGMDIKTIKAIYSPTQEQAFELRIKLLQEREGRNAFEPKWSRDTNPGLRAEIIAKLREMVTPYHDEEYGAVKYISMWHGTRPEVLDSIFKTGYTDLSTTDDGFFGRGIYGSYEAKYAYEIYSKGALLINWVIFFSAYPVIDGDMPKLRGKSHYENYDAHCIPLQLFPNGGVNPCTGSVNEARYHEIVVFESAQCLPRYLVELQPSLPQAPGIIIPISPTVFPAVTKAPATPTCQDALLSAATSVECDIHPGLQHTKIVGDADSLYKAVTYYLTQKEDIALLRSIVADKIKHRDFPGLRDEQSLQDYVARLSSEVPINILMLLLDRPIVVIDTKGAISNTTMVNKYLGKEPIFVFCNPDTRPEHYDVLMLRDGHDGSKILTAMLYGATRVSTTFFESKGPRKHHHHHHHHHKHKAVAMTTLNPAP